MGYCYCTWFGAFRTRYCDWNPTQYSANDKSIRTWAITTWLDEIAGKSEANINHHAFGPWPRSRQALWSPWTWNGRLSPPFLPCTRSTLELLADLSPRMPVCFDFNSPRGCRRNPCRFTHEKPENANSHGSASAKSPVAKQRRVQPIMEAPNGICRYYYNLGSCKRDPCRFLHPEPGTLGTAIVPGSGFLLSSTQSKNDTAASYGERAVKPAWFSVVAPSDALYHLGLICAPRATFTRPSQVMKFVNLLANAGSRDSTWDEKDAQRFLEIVSEGHGLSRIEAILTFDPVVVQVDTSREPISFTSAYVPCLGYLVSSFVLDSTLATRVNSLYGLIHTHFDRISTIITTCMTTIVEQKSFKDRPFGISCGAEVFRTLIQVVVEYINRFKSAFRDHRSLAPLTESISSWIDQWKAGGFVDTEIGDGHAKKVVMDKIQRDLHRLLSMATRESAAITHKDGSQELKVKKGPSSTSIIGSLAIHYDPAGTLRSDGPRHDNDSEDIRTISIAPTEAEMMCKISPFLPANIPGAPHHLASESMERLLDIQFRLLREELIAPLRLALQSIISDLLNPSKKTPLHSLLAKKGGRYTAETGHSDSVMASVYTSVDPVAITTDKRGVATELVIDTPPGQARNRSASQRVEYWKAISRKRLMQGGLVGLVWASRGNAQLFFGLISSSVEELQFSSRESPDSLRIRVKFFDELVNSKVMEWCQLHPRDRRGTTILMVEASVMYESIRPFLMALQQEPTSFPFSRYLVHRLDASRHLYRSIDPPHYTFTRLGFTWNLKCVMNEEMDLVLDPNSANSIAEARQQLRSSSQLDPSQADAMVDCLTKEFCLIQGPPGTGKSYTGIEIMKVLLANHVKPILLIAFTNHALDHLLRSVLDMGITSKIARLGSRSNDEELKQFSLDALEQLANADTMDKSAIKRAYFNLKRSEEELSDVLKQLQGSAVSEEDRTEYLELCRPDHHDELMHPPVIVNSILASEEGWTQVGAKQAESLFEFWRTGRDIIWIDRAHSSTDAKAERQLSNRFVKLNVDDLEDEDETLSFDEDFTDFEDSLEDDEESGLRTFLEAAGLTALPSIPSTDRPLDELQADPMVWTMSRNERSRLTKAWEEGARQHFFDRNRTSFTYLKTKYEDAKRAYEECKDQAKLRILAKVDIIGCTTTGAAKLTALLSGTRPSVLLVEEAGQVLEAHILGSLVQSIEHVIMIGDPLQLRPTINNYSLSMDHKVGKKIYKFDQSTMERLDEAGMAMSQLNVQRRMRPEIASIARSTLYPLLEDNAKVTGYPAVRGLARNIFFFHHTHAEGGADEESMSKYNTFEITMTKTLVLHLLRQGSYSKRGSIVVLCMYLGQLAKLRDELRKSRVGVVLDARDEEELRNREGDVTPGDEGSSIQVLDVKLSDQVLLRTVDNFQGEEADIVILSLVRNHGPEKTGTIGFLKSTNRVNVALTRARQGLFVFGNGDLLSSKSDMWSKVTEYFKELDSYGTALPIACHMHPDTVQWVNTAEQLRQVSPDGGCLRPCEDRLACGHTCPSKCHADDSTHRFVRCYEPCRRACKKGHPCNRLCWEDCGKCRFPVPIINLDCGHTLRNGPCYLEDEKDSFKCPEIVDKQLPNCEHTAQLECHADPASHICEAICQSILPCCGKNCRFTCGRCQKISTTGGFRDNHVQHLCERILHCQHFCAQPCRVGHSDACGTTECSNLCRQNCDHHKCRLGCSTPCSPCAMACPWSCQHHRCPVPCGSPCVRLPCDLRCPEVLECGHPCPSLCGEPCAKQRCHQCASVQEREKVVDLILGNTIEDLDLASDDLDNITIALGCGHTFTVETLDGICELTHAYEKDITTNQWTALNFTQSSFVKTPGCPTCRHPIDARRYGRVTKRSNLDLLERNIATKMAKQLRSVHSVWAALDHLSLEKTVTLQVTHRPQFTKGPKALDKHAEFRNILLSNTVQSVVPLDVFNRSLPKYSGLPKADSDQWRKDVEPLLQIYEQVTKVLETRTAHTSAYEASFSMLYETELRSALMGPNPPQYPERYALRISKLKVGMTPPRADTRFAVEGIWLTIDVRFALGTLAERVFSHLASQSERNQAQIDAWGHFTAFIYNTCSRDAGIAFKLASSTQAHRQQLLTSMRIIKSAWRATQFLVISRQSQGMASDIEEREILTREVEDRLSLQRKNAEAIRDTYIRQGGLSREVVERDFDVPVRECFKYWEDLLTTLKRPAVFYQAVSEKELQEVVGSFKEFSHRGHWYTCPNGHIFTIGECGGAMQISRCHECGSTIGGSNHQTVDGVQQAANLERIAATQGAAASPWRWNNNV